MCLSAESVDVRIIQMLNTEVACTNLPMLCVAHYAQQQT